jgi:AcrR family transcriptional regulator
MGRPREHDENTRDRLLDAAERVSETDGWEAVTVRRVAQEADTSTRAVYALFDSKEGLEQALHEAMFARLLELSRARRRSDDPRSDLASLTLAYRRWATERPQRYAIAMHHFLGSRAASRSEEGLGVARAVLDELRQVVRRCHQAGLLGDSDPEQVMVQLRAMAHGLAEFENLGLLGPDPESEWLLAVDALLGARPGGRVEAEVTAAG